MHSAVPRGYPRTPLNRAPSGNGTGTQGISTDVRHVDPVQDGSHRRALTLGNVGVPGALIAGRFRRLFKAHQFRELSIGAEKWVQLEITETARKRDVLGWSDRLVAEEDNLVGGKGSGDFRYHLVRRFGGKVGSAQDSTDGRALRCLGWSPWFLLY
jgi:hypothetical protein